MADLFIAFARHHEENPGVWELFQRFTLEAIRAGRAHFGAKAIMERMRWFTDIESRGDAFKVNNNFAAFYARMFEQEFPQHAGFFRKRHSAADDVCDDSEGGAE